MPFTPFHLGFGAVAKVIGRANISFLVFGGSQVLMDIEPGIRMLTGSAILHGPSHTLHGALFIGIVAALVGKPVTDLVLRLFRVANPRITWRAAWTGAFTGTFSHILLDGFMHADMQPFSPLTSANPLLGALSLKWLHGSLLLGALLGGIAVWYLRIRSTPD